MGRVADNAGIQFRVLNRAKGPAVRGPRAQTDRKLYREAMQAAIRDIANLSVIEAEAADILLENGRVEGIETAQWRNNRLRRARPDDRNFFARRHPYRHQNLSGGAHGGKPGDPPRRETAGTRPWPWAPQDRNAAKARWRHDRLGHARTPERRRRAGALFLSDRGDPHARRSIASSPIRLPKATQSSKKILASRRSIPARFRAGGRAIAPRSKTRWFASRSARRIRFSSNRRD